MSRFTDVIGRLAETIESRRGGDTSTSYTAQLLGDLDRAAKKMGEEAVETVIAAAQGDRDALTAESADLMYHWLVVIAAAGVSLTPHASGITDGQHVRNDRLFAENLRRYVTGEGLLNVADPKDVLAGR